MTRPLALTGWSSVSPLGVGVEPFGAAVRAGTDGLEPGGPERGLPTEHVGLVPGFQVRESLGRKNTRSMDRATGPAVLTVGMLLEADRVAGHAFDGDEVGLVLGTTTGSVQSMTDFTRDSLTRDKPYDVDPARFPNTVMNCAAGQSAIWHGLRGPDTTVAGGALESAEDARAEGREVPAELVAVRLGVSAGPEQTPDELASCAASGALLPAAVPSHAQEDPAAADCLAPLLSVDRDGHYGCAVLRMTAREGR